MIEYTVAANISINIQEIGFTNKLIDLLVYRSLARTYDAYILCWYPRDMGLIS